jgi:type II secretory pathway predicted ATPase ExeA
VLTGEVGIGKTMLLRSLIETVGPKTQTAYVFNPPRTVDALYDSIGYELGITLNGAANPQPYSTAIFYLLTKTAEQLS